MSEMGFGYYGSESGEEGSEDLSAQAPAGAEPKWFRDYMAKARKQNEELLGEVTRLRQESRQNAVAKVFEAKGFDPAAASLYGGEPEKVDEWLSTHGALLAKRPEGAPEGAEGGEQTPAGPPASSVPPEAQEQMQRMQSAGVGEAAAPRGSDAELAAAIGAATSMEELAAIFKANGSRFEF